MSNRQINASQLGFEEVKTELIEFMKGQDGAFQDYNFEGSAMNTIIDVLSYITHINSINANFALNETFLDTAQIRSSVVSHAKLLGYTPRSKKPSSAAIGLSVLPSNALNANPELVLKRGTIFNTNIESTTYNLISANTHTTQLINGVYTFDNVELHQGTVKSNVYIYDSAGTEEYIITDPTVYTGSVSVKVYDNGVSDKFDTYLVSPNLVNITEYSEVFFIEETRIGLYKISFGDNVIGKQPEYGSRIVIEYTAVGLGDINTANVFNLADSIDGNTNVVINTIKPAGGGADRETIDSIKFNAPLGFTAQNRAVTPDDYKGILQNTYGNIEAISVWGGEDNNPPDYGKVYISIKPLGTNNDEDNLTLSDYDKDLIISRYLKPKNLISITPIVVDPSYTFIQLDIWFKYNPNLTTDSGETLESKVIAAINNFNHTMLNTFDGVFRSSNVSSLIDNTSKAILSNIMKVTMIKRLRPMLDGTSIKYTLDYNQPLSQYNESGYMTSDQFIYNSGSVSKNCILIAIYNSELNTHIIRIVDAITNELYKDDVGTLDSTTGRIDINDFVISSIVDTSKSYIRIFTKPRSSDVKPLRNELLTISDTTNILGEVDTMAIGGTTAGIGYTTRGTD